MKELNTDADQSSGLNKVFEFYFVQEEDGGCWTLNIGFRLLNKVLDLLPTVQHRLQDLDQRLDRRSVQRIPAALIHLTEGCWEITELLQSQPVTCRGSLLLLLVFRLI